MNASMWSFVSFSCCSRGSFAWSLTCTQTTILTVVAVVNRRVTGTPSVHGASRQRAASRHAPRAMSTSGWSLPGYGTWASGETRTRPSEGDRCASEWANTPCTLCRSAIFVFWGGTTAASCARDFEREPLLQTCQACCRWSQRRGLDDPPSPELQSASAKIPALCMSPAPGI
jgi:hypothetical protein